MTIGGLYAFGLQFMQMDIRQLYQEVSEKKKKKRNRKFPPGLFKFLILEAATNSPCRPADLVVQPNGAYKDKTEWNNCFPKSWDLYMTRGKHTCMI